LSSIYDYYHIYYLFKFLQSHEKKMTDLLLATNNPGKILEMESILSVLQLNLVTPAQLGIDLEVSEDGCTYAENATLKAMAFSQASGLIALGDDSGLEVDLLDGKPGLHSHRFGPGVAATDADRRAYLLNCLRGKNPPWKAHFHCEVAIAIPQGGLRYTVGDCPGEIIATERGSNGFGYDPVFFLPEFQATMAELPPETKNMISHRARALQAAIPILRELL
jgi:XTP/dITP diphosphohydrolase